MEGEIYKENCKSNGVKEKYLKSRNILRIIMQNQSRD